jgi:hypothetical protein
MSAETPIAGVAPRNRLINSSNVQICPHLTLRVPFSPEEKIEVWAFDMAARYELEF